MKSKKDFNFSLFSNISLWSPFLFWTSVQSSTFFNMGCEFSLNYEIVAFSISLIAL